MAPWIWLLTVGGGFFLLMCVAFSTHSRRQARAKHGKLGGKQQRVSAPSSGLRIDPLRGMRGEPTRNPSSVYLGQVYFFDSVEHRDMFEANQHRPVTTGALLAVTQEQHGRRLERQEAADTSDGSGHRRH